MQAGSWTDPGLGGWDYCMECKPIMFPSVS
jgi:hypothetical protein